MTPAIDLPLADAVPTGARIVRVETTGRRRTPRLTVEFSTDVVYPGLRLAPEFPWNWQLDGATTLVLDVTNPTDHAVPVGLRVDDGQIPEGNFVAASASVPPGAHRVMFRLQGLAPDDPYTLPAPSHELPIRLGSVVLHPRVGTEFDLSHVTAVTVYLSHPTARTTLVLGGLTRVAEQAAPRFAFGR